MKTVIVGGGIAGLALAAVLTKLGEDDFVVLEKTENLREEGAGIQIASNAMQVMDWLDLREDVFRIGHVNQGNIYRRLEDDSIVKYVVTGDRLEEIYGIPAVQVNRQDLATLLESKIPEGRIRYSANCVEVKDHGTSAEVILDSGESITADYVVGADGIHSIVREQIFGPAKKSLAIAGWRAMIPEEEARSIPLAKWSHVWFGEGKSAVSYWINGGKNLNFVGAVVTTESQTRDWRTAGSVEDLRAIYSGVSPVVEDLVSRIRTAFITDIFSTEPIDTYVSGRIVLMGDAAHPMMPLLAAGAGQGIEDAYALGASMVRASNPLQVYDELRCARGNKVQAASEKMSILYHGTDDPEADISGTGFESQEKSQDIGDFRQWLWGYNIIEEVENRLK